MVDVHWPTIAEPMFGKKTESMRKWKSHFGVSIRELSVIWFHVDKYITENELEFHPIFLLVTLYFLRVYETEDRAETFLNISAKTYRKWYRRGLDILYDSLPEVISFFLI